MNTTTALSVSRAARVGAQVFDDVTSNGLPGDVSLSASIDYDPKRGGLYERVTFQFFSDDFADLRLWATFLGAETRVRVSQFNDALTFCDAETVVGGVVVQLTGNRTEERN